MKIYITKRQLKVLLAFSKIQMDYQGRFKIRLEEILSKAGVFIDKSLLNFYLLYFIDTGIVKSIDGKRTFEFIEETAENLIIIDSKNTDSIPSILKILKSLKKKFFILKGIKEVTIPRIIASCDQTDEEKEPEKVEEIIREKEAIIGCYEVLKGETTFMLRSMKLIREDFERLSELLK